MSSGHRYRVSTPHKLPAFGSIFISLVDTAQENMRANNLIVNIFFGKISHQILQEERAYTFGDLIGNSDHKTHFVFMRSSTPGQLIIKFPCGAVSVLNYSKLRGNYGHILLE